MCLIILRGSHGFFYGRQESLKGVGLPRMWLRGGQPAEDETEDKATSHLLYCYCFTQDCFQSCLRCESKKGSSKIKHLFGIQLTKLSTA